MMTMMISELYDALLSAGCPEDKARRAAVAMAITLDRAQQDRELARYAWRFGITMTAVLIASFGFGMFLSWLAWGLAGTHH